MNWYTRYSGAGRINLWRGESSYNRGGRFWSTDREWARQFTQSGRASEVRGMSMRAAEIWRADPPPPAVDPAALDRVGAEARGLGYGAFWVDEGPGEPESVCVMGGKAVVAGARGDVARAVREDGPGDGRGKMSLKNLQRLKEMTGPQKVDITERIKQRMRMPPDAYRQLSEADRWVAPSKCLQCGRGLGIRPIRNRPGHFYCEVCSREMAGVPRK